MGEEAWEAYQKQRKIDKAKTWKARNAQAVVDWRRRTKQRLIDYKGGKCERCGYCKDCPSAYHFHHLDPSQKDFGISENGSTRKLDKLKKEVDKCQLLCSNCHAEVHEEMFKQVRQQTKERYEEWLEKRNIVA